MKIFLSCTRFLFYIRANNKKIYVNVKYEYVVIPDFKLFAK